MPRVLFFDVKPTPQGVAPYLASAAALKPHLDAIGGCTFIDRFKSLEDSRWLLSHQLWRDEAAMTAWRVHEAHHKTQTKERYEVFEDYRLRVAELLREEEPGKPAWQASSQSSYRAREASAKRRLVVTVESTSATFDAPTGLPGKAFESINRAGEFIHVIACEAWEAALEVTENCRIGAPAYRYRICEVDRDYGLHERGEAPQYYAPKR